MTIHSNVRPINKLQTFFHNQCMPIYTPFSYVQETKKTDKWRNTWQIGPFWQDTLDMSPTMVKDAYLQSDDDDDDDDDDVQITSWSLE